jgi:hypothetical protein
MYRGYDEDLCCLFCGEYLYVSANGLLRASPPPPEMDIAPHPRGRARKALAVA